MFNGFFLRQQLYLYSCIIFPSIFIVNNLSSSEGLHVLFYESLNAPWKFFPLSWSQRGILWSVDVQR